MAENVRDDLAQLRLIRNQNAEALKSGDGGSTFDDMSNERLAKLEGVVEGLRHVQSVTLTLVGLIVALVIAFGTYTANRLDAINGRVAELPGKISSDLRDITKTLSEAITAAKQTPPQVILLPAPDAPAPRKTDQKPN